MVKVTKQLYVTNRKAWRTWLEENYSTAKEIWLVYYKKHTGKPRIHYDDAVEEALCFGWIDSTVKRFDDEKYIQRYTPRKDKSVWSETNKKRAAEMIKLGRMTDAGLVKIEAAKRSGEWQKKLSQDKQPLIPPDLEQALASNKKARKNFYNFAPSYRKQYVFWITSAKRKTTREKRISETVKMSALNRKPRMN